MHLYTVKQKQKEASSKPVVKDFSSELPSPYDEEDTGMPKRKLPQHSVPSTPHDGGYDSIPVDRVESTRTPNKTFESTPRPATRDATSSQQHLLVVSRPPQSPKMHDYVDNEHTKEAKFQAIKEENTKLKEDVEDLTQKLTDMECRLEEATKIDTEKEKSVEQRLTERFEQRFADIEKKIENNNGLSDAVEAMRIEDSDIKQKLSKLERENEHLKHKIEELDKVYAENEELKEENKELKKENAQLKDKIKKLECIEESLHERLEKLYIEKVELKKKAESQ